MYGEIVGIIRRRSYGMKKNSIDDKMQCEHLKLSVASQSDTIELHLITLESGSRKGGVLLVTRIHSTKQNDLNARGEGGEKVEQEKAHFTSAAM